MAKIKVTKMVETEIELQTGMVFKGGITKNSLYILALAEGGSRAKYHLTNIHTGGRWDSNGTMEDIEEQLLEESFTYVGMIDNVTFRD